jgi:beta-fructofuranosidase
MNYSPKGLYVWDAWYMPVEGAVHAYHLQQVRAKDAADKSPNDLLGHAVTRDLVHWEERSPAFGPDPANPHDDRQPWTGCAVWHEGRGHLFYTMRGSANNCRVQRIGLATTHDPDRWTRHPGNPVIVPDPRWYATEGNPVPRLVDCRDLIVVPHPDGGWLGFYATRIPGNELPQTSAIACVRSADLVHWQHLPPAFAPGTYACLEVPDVFELNGRWYLTCLTGHFYGNRGYWADPNLVCGTMYAVADRPEGPYRELADNALLAARYTAPLSCRSFLFEGRRYLLYTDRERGGGTDAGGMAFGTLTTPKELRTDGNRLFVAYSDRIESDVAEELIGSGRPPVEEPSKPWAQLWAMPSARWTWGDTIAGESASGWGVACLAARGSASFLFEATITLERGVAAGLVLRRDGPMAAAVVALEPVDGVVSYYEAPAFDFVEKRRTAVPFGRPVRLRVVNRLEHVEVYVDDDLRLAFSRYRGIGGQFGLFVDRARAVFTNVRLRELVCGRTKELE